ncbi:transposase [Peribacillus sp. NPDC060186]
MPRKLRIWYPGSIYHITSRGNRHSDIFLDDKDRLRYLHHVEKTKAWLLPHTNHVHLLIETMQYPISDIMHKLNSCYSISFNRRNDHDEHLFQGRYHSVLIESIDNSRLTNRYIYLNPVKANIVKNPAEYKWSSYKAFQIGKPNMQVNPTLILHYFQTPQNYKRYVMRGSALPPTHKKD